MISELQHIWKVKNVLACTLVLGQTLDVERISIIALELDNEDGIQLLESQEFESIEELFKVLKTNKLPIVLNVKGKGIITKELKLDSDNSNEILSQVFPNAITDDFHLQTLKLTKTLVSVVRKNTLNPILEQFEKEKQHIVQIVLDDFALFKIYPILFPGNQSVSFSDKLMNFDGVGQYSILKGTYEPHEAELDDKRLNESLLAATCSGMHWLLDKEDATHVPNIGREQFNAFTHARIFNVLKYASPIFLLIVAIINLFFFNNYNQQLQAVYVEKQNVASLLEEQNFVKNDLALKTSFIEEAGWLSTAPVSYYTDRLVGVMSSRISLQEMNVFPIVENKTSSQSKNTFNTHLITVSGSCEEAKSLNEWKKSIVNFDWVKEGVVSNYELNNKTKLIDFTLKIEI